MRFVLPAPDPHDGLSFALSDLQAAMAWATARPSLRLRVATHYRRSPEIIQIYLLDAVRPRWVLWRDYTGHLHVDDWAVPEFDINFLSVIEALGFIEARFE
jgi:hypothetical protein